MLVYVYVCTPKPPKKKTKKNVAIVKLISITKQGKLDEIARYERIDLNRFTFVTFPENFTLVCVPNFLNLKINEVCPREERRELVT